MSSLPIWREDYKEQVRNNFRSGRLPHAQLLSGKSGSGLMAHALWQASLLLCNDPEDAVSCGKCSGCIKSAKFVHPDLHFTFPVVNLGKSKIVTSDLFSEQWRDYISETTYPDYRKWIESISGETIKQGNISKAECDRIRYLSQLKAYEGGNKVFVIWMAEILGKEGNRLLKILEEPPENTFFILISHQPARIISTILSRVQHYKFPKYQRPQIESLLQNLNSPLSESRKMEILNIADGNAGQAIFLAENGQDEWSENLLTLLRLAYLKNGVDASKWIAQSARWSRDQLIMFFTYSLHFMEESIRSKSIGKTYEKQLSREEQKAANWVIEKFGFEQMEKMIKIFSENIIFINRNANAKILLFATVTKLIQAFHTKER